MILVIILSLLVVCFFGWANLLLSKIEIRDKKINGFLSEKFKEGYTIDKIINAEGFQSFVVRLYADNKYWELDVDKDKGITQEIMLINQN